MNGNIGIGQGADIGSIQRESDTAGTVSDTGALPDGVRFRQAGGSGSTKARERHRLDRRVLQSLWNRITASVKSSSIVSFFKGRAARTLPASANDEINKMRQATLAKGGAMRPAGMNSAPTAAPPASTMPARADVPPTPPPASAKPSRADVPPAPPSADLKPSRTEVPAALAGENLSRSDVPPTTTQAKLRETVAPPASPDLKLPGDTAPERLKQASQAHPMMRFSSVGGRPAGQASPEEVMALLGQVTVLEARIAQLMEQVQANAAQVGSGPAPTPPGLAGAVPSSPPGAPPPAAPPPPPLDLMSRALKPKQEVQSSATASLRSNEGASQDLAEKTPQAKPQPVRSDTEQAMLAELTRKFAARALRQQAGSADATLPQ